MPDSIIYAIISKKKDSQIRCGKYQSKVVRKNSNCMVFSKNFPDFQNFAHSSVLSNKIEVVTHKQTDIHVDKNTYTHIWEYDIPVG